MNKKRYVVPLRNAQRLLERGDAVGTEFLHHRVRMVITAVGQPFRQGKEYLFYFEAEEKSESNNQTQPDPLSGGG